MRTLLIAVALVLGLQPLSLTNDVLTVGPTGQFDTIQAAVDAAAEGDIVLVQGPPADTVAHPHGFHPFTRIANKSLTLVGDRQGGERRLRGLSVEGLAEDQAVHVLGLELWTDLSTPALLEIVDCVGPVRLQQNTLTSWVAPATVTRSRDVSFRDCDLVASGANRDGLLVQHSFVSLHGCQLTAASGDAFVLPPAAGGDGLRVRSSVVFAEGSTFRGGQGSDESCFVFGISVDTPPGPGGSGVVLESAVLRHRASSFFAGSGGEAGGCHPDAAAGLPIDQTFGRAVSYVGPVRTLSVPHAPREDETFPVTLQGLPGELAFVIWSAAADQFWAPAVEAPLLLAQPLTLKFVGATDPTGAASFLTRYPELGAGVDGRVFHAQPLFLDGQGQLSLGGVHTTVALDRSF